MRSTVTNPTGLTIHFVGDPHIRASYSVLSQVRQDRFSKDIRDGLVPVPSVRVCLGDLSNENGSNVNATADDNAAVAFFDALSDGADWYTAIGNHDIWRANRTGAQAAAAYGQSGVNQVIDLGACKLIVVGPDTMNYPSDANTIYLTQTTCDWLETQLQATSKDCLVVCHAPLKDTVIDSGENGSTVFDSSTSGFFVCRTGDSDDTYIRSLLEENTNAIAWVSGHCHVDPRRANIFSTTTIGSRTIASINCPVLYYVTPSVDATDPLWSVYVTYRGGDLDCRLRNHGNGTWDGTDSGRVTTL